MRRRSAYRRCHDGHDTAGGGLAEGRAPRPSNEFISKVRHEILMLPYFDVFDNITFKVEGYDVTLSGQALRPTLKTGAERVVPAI